MGHYGRVNIGHLRTLAAEGLDRRTIAERMGTSVESVRRLAVARGIVLSDMRGATKEKLGKGDGPAPAPRPAEVPAPSRPPPTRAALRLAQFDPVVARALGLREPEPEPYRDWGDRNGDADPD